jgi:hypothetical protein
LFFGARVQFRRGEAAHNDKAGNATMAITTGFQQQQPFARSAAVRSAPSPQNAARLDLSGEAKAFVAPQEKSFSPRLKR